MDRQERCGHCDNLYSHQEMSSICNKWSQTPQKILSHTLAVASFGLQCHGWSRAGTKQRPFHSHCWAWLMEIRQVCSRAWWRMNMDHSSGVATRTCLHTSLSLAGVVGHHRNARPILSLELVQAKPSQQVQRGDPQHSVAGRSCQDSCSLSAHTKPQGRGWRQLSSVPRAGVGCVVLSGGTA